MKKVLFKITVLAFVGNFIWENVQMPLYGYTYANFWHHLFMCFWASIGDVVIFTAFYLIVVFYRKDWFWIRRIHVSDVVILPLLGLATAVIVEKIALGSSIWRYTSAMPIIPGLHIGLFPIVQLVVLPLLTFYLVPKRMLNASRL